MPEGTTEMPATHAQSIASLYTPSGRRKYLTECERARFLETAWRCPRSTLRTLALVLIHTGCRISEALALTPASIEAESGFLAFRCLKRRRKTIIVREVPLPEDVLAELQHVHRDCPREQHLWPLSRSWAWHLIKALMDDAAIPQGPHATPRGLRHGFGLHAVQSGVPLNLVQRWLGHASMTTTAIYLQAMGQEERAIAARMWA